MAEQRAITEQQQQQTEQEQAPKLCAKLCGFYGNPACLDMCSKCYREHMAEQQKAQPGAAAAPPTAALAAEAPAPPPKPVEAAAPEVVAEQEKPAVAAPPAATQAQLVAELAKEEAASPERPVQANRSRCFCCSKKVGLLGFECRCGYVYCASHRHASEHSCTFDYKTMDRAKLAKANPTVAAARVDKI